MTGATPPTLEELGWTADLERSVELGGLRPARVSSVYGTRVDVWDGAGEKMIAVRRMAKRDAPIEGGIAVGDWVLVGANGDVVERVLPRRTELLRQAAGERSEPQAIAANIDLVFVMTSLEGDFNPRRLERYLVAVRAGGATPIVLLGKADLEPDPSAALAEVAALGAPEVILVSARTGQGVEEVRARISRGITAAFVGSSGVGKSALLNVLLGRVVSVEGEVRAHDKRGRHTTTRRSLYVVPGGGLLVDTPGMRELKPWQPEGAGDEDAFDDVAELAASCRYRDCRHEAEPGCAVTAAVASGTIGADRVASWKKLERERAERSARQERFASNEQKRLSRAYTTEQRKRKT